MMIVSKPTRHLLAGIWFAIAAAIPVGQFFWLFQNSVPLFGPSPIFATLLPILIAGICGSLLGTPILDPERTKSPFRAALRGLLIAMLSYVILITVSAVINTVPSADPLGSIGFFVVVFLYGLLLVGWLVALAGALAGWLLYLFRVKVIDIR